MIAYLSGVVSASPIGRSFARLRNGPVGDFASSSFLDWVIPPTLTALIVVAGVWIVFVPK